MSRPPDRPALGAGLVVAAALLWAATGLFTPPLLDRGLTPTTIACWRAVVAGAAFALHAGLTGDVARHSRRLLVTFGVVGVGFLYVALPATIDAGGVSLAWLLLFTAPAWVALWAPRVLGEPSDRRTLALVGVTVAGVAVVALAGGDGVVVSVRSMAWGMGSGLAFATWFLVSQRAGTTPVATASIALPVGAVTLLPFARWPEADVTTWALLVGLGLVSTYLPVLCYYVGLAHLAAARAAVLSTVEPVAALAVAAVVFGERLTPLALVGAAAIVAAAALAATAEPVARVVEPDPEPEGL